MAVKAVSAPRLPAALRATVLARLVVPVMLSAAGTASAQAQDKQPSTFAPVIGGALLCRDQIDNRYLYAWLASHFGPPYKHEGGAFWFRTGEATLWGAPVTEVMVGDDTGGLAFLAAVAELPPDQLEQSVRTGAGIKYPAADASPYPLRISAPGSTIAYYNSKSKIYCAKFKPLPPRP